MRDFGRGKGGKVQRRVMARETVLSRIGAKEKVSQEPIRSARGLVRRPGAVPVVVVLSLVTAGASLAALTGWACCWAGETAEGAIVVGLSASVRGSVCPGTGGEEA